MPTEQTHFFDLTRDDLREVVQQWRMPGYRADQLLKWVYERRVTDPRRMTDLSKADRDRIAERLVFERWTVAAQQDASDGTRKLLLGSGSGQTECVMIPAESRDSGRPRRTACISSQIGCPVGCRFCASGLGGLEANLTAGQIVEQVHQLNRLADGGTDRADADGPRPGEGPSATSPVTNVVFMGMGEPLANFANVTRAIRTLNAPWAYNLSARRITVSTVGLPAQIRRLADQLDLPVTLAISLHAPNDALRRELIPWAERTRVDDLIDAGRYYFSQTGREITLEYILLRGVNDRPEHARQLAQVARTLRSNVNLIRYNEVMGIRYNRPDSRAVHQFQQVLRQAGVNAHIRASRGRDIAAACGQLRHESAAGGP